MIKNKETILQEKTDQLHAHVKSYLDNMDALSNSDDFTIDKIEKMWGNLEDSAKLIIREINEDMVSAVDEKHMIKVKKKSIPSAE